MSKILKGSLSYNNILVILAANGLTRPTFGSHLSNFQEMRVKNA